MATATTQSHPADERILAYLGENPPDYAALIATRLGMDLRYVERRLDALADRGLVEPVTGEAVYTTTERGANWLCGAASGGGRE
jgi:DNA-binding MarR family transcriptional regulator